MLARRSLGLLALTPALAQAQPIAGRRATQDADGGWTLTGSKIWIGNGHRAGVIATFAIGAGLVMLVRRSGGPTSARRVE